MAFNGSGVFVRLYNWVNDKNASINITASRMDAEFDGMATGLSNCITKDGQTTVTANLPMAGFRHTAVSDASATNQYLTYLQAQGSTATWLGTAGGTADAATVSPSIGVTSYVTGAEFAYIPVGTNTITTPTINISGLGTKAITYRGSALQIGDIPSAGVVQIRYNGTSFDMLNAPLSRILKAKGTAIASAATTDIGAADSDFIDVTGTTGITSFGSTTTRNHVWVNFTGILTVTHNATSLILPGAANYTTAAGDVFECVRISGSNWQVVSITRTNGSPLAGTVFYTNLASANIATTSDLSSGTASKVVSAASVSPLMYSTKAYQTTGVSVPANTWTDMTFDSEEWDDAGWHSTSVNTNRITVDFTGRVQVIASYLANTTAGTNIGIRVQKNGVTVARTLYACSSSASELQQGICVAEVPVSSGDYINIQVVQNTGGAVTSGTGTSGTSLTVRRIK